MKKPTIKKLNIKGKIQKLRERQSKTFSALRNFVNEERQNIDRDVTDPIDHTIYRLRGFHSRIKDRRETGREHSRTGFRRGASAVRKLLFENMLSTKRSKKRRVVK